MVNVVETVRVALGFDPDSLSPRHDFTIVDFSIVARILLNSWAAIFFTVKIGDI